MFIVYQLVTRKKSTLDLDMFWLYSIVSILFYSIVVKLLFSITLDIDQGKSH